MIRTEKIKIGDKDIEIRPLNGKYIKHIFNVMKTFSGITEDSSETAFMENMTESATESMFTLVKATLEKAKLGISEEELEELVTQNMFIVIGDVLKVNMPKQ